MLIKAAAAAAQIEAFPAVTCAGDDPAPAAAAIDERDLTIARLEDRAAELEARIAQLRRDGAEALARGTAEAKAAAAREHVAADDRRFRALSQQLAAMRRTFEERLEGDCAALAQRIALEGFERLVEAAADEKDWLGRLTARRLSALVRASVVTVRLSEADYSAEQGERLRDLIPVGTEIDVAADLAEGEARIVLRLGEVMIDAVAGAARVAALIAEAPAEASAAHEPADRVDA
jgi:hypothetical protein